MVQDFEYNNPITNKKNIIKINIDNFNEIDYYTFEKYINTIESLKSNIKLKLKDLNIIVYKNKQVFTTNSYIYYEKLSILFKLLYKINNQIEYNNYITELENIHKNNIILEYQLSTMLKEGIDSVKRTPKTDKKVTKPKNKWIQHTTRDMFTGEETYIYENLLTGETFESKDKNKLTELNAKPKKDKVIHTKLFFKFKL